MNKNGNDLCHRGGGGGGRGRFFFDVETKDKFRVEKITVQDDPLTLVAGMWDNAPSPDDAIMFSNDAACLDWLSAESDRNATPKLCGSIEDLLECLDTASAIIAYNHNFDMTMLKPYCGGSDNYEYRRAAWEKKSIDPCDIMKKKCGFSASLDEVARLNVGAQKSGTSSDAPLAWRQLNIKHLWEYCRLDVVLMMQIYAVTTKWIVPEKTHQCRYALTEVDVHKQIRKRERQLLLSGSTQTTAVIANSPSRIRNIGRERIEELLSKIEIKISESS